MSSIPETEVLFLVLTHIQRDLITEAPGQMSLIVNCLREAFLSADVPQQVITHIEPPTIILLCHIIIFSVFIGEEDLAPAVGATVCRLAAAC